MQILLILTIPDSLKKKIKSKYFPDFCKWDKWLIEVRQVIDHNQVM